MILDMVLVYGYAAGYASIYDLLVVFLNGSTGSLA